MSRRAVILGATGLIGGALLRTLLQQSQWQQLTLVGRRHPDIEADPRIRLVTASLDDLDQHKTEFAVDDVFCCLGTTLRQAGSKAAFERVDKTFCVHAAQQAAAAGAKRFIMVSAVNANRHGISFYARTKGEAEREVIAAGVPMTAFMQPSLLQGHRAEFRLGEEIGLKTLALVMPLARWTRADWLPIEAQTVANAMVAVALQGPDTGIHRLRYQQMSQYAESL
ncbi:MAG: hypothetical protein CVV10_02155 [Gammaproteobacteria bacterium HGW-Gammaproteobacteria-14]|nr:MAG: hypothetical protein CVV10_02155 [Gammaproteobacteria bacterium HGW-Gammaproteobacteria-14]